MVFQERGDGARVLLMLFHPQRECFHAALDEECIEGRQRRALGAADERQTVGEGDV